MSAIDPVWSAHDYTEGHNPAMRGLILLREMLPSDDDSSVTRKPMQVGFHHESIIPVPIHQVLISRCRGNQTAWLYILI